MEAILAFVAGLVALRLGGDLIRRWRAQPAHGRQAQFAAWAASFGAYAFASGALAWGAAAGWDDRSFRVYYLFGGLLTAPLLGVGSLLLVERRWAAPLGLLYAGLAVGVAVAAPLTSPVTGSSIPSAQDHLAFVPARLVAVLGNTLGTIAVVGIALLTLRHRPLANLLIIGGVAVAGVGSAISGLGEGGSAAFIAVAVVLLYLGVLEASGTRASFATLLPHWGRDRSSRATPAASRGRVR